MGRSASHARISHARVFAKGETLKYLDAAVGHAPAAPVSLTKPLGWAQKLQTSEARTCSRPSWHALHASWCSRRTAGQVQVLRYFGYRAKARLDAHVHAEADQKPQLYVCYKSMPPEPCSERGAISSKRLNNHGEGIQSQECIACDSA